MCLEALLAGAVRTALAGRKVAGHLLEALSGALVVVEHRRVVVELDELAYPPQRRLGVGHEVLVADLDVVVVDDWAS